jgi:DNA-binding response OmpR family regulator
MPPKILLVDDDTTLLRFVGEYLDKEGYTVSTADRGEKALRLFYGERPDLVLLDVMMPGMDGWEVCARLRELADTPIIMLTAKTAEAEKLRGFKLGVDDYITKPFSLAELMARLRAVLSRSLQNDNEGASVYQAGALMIDPRKRQALLDGKPLDLTPTEYRLLAVMGKRAGQAVSQEDIQREIWGDYREQSGSALRRYVWLLRQKIEDDPDAPERLVTIRGFGYRLEA